MEAHHLICSLVYNSSILDRSITTDALTVYLVNTAKNLDVVLDGKLDFCDHIN